MFARIRLGTVSVLAPLEPLATPSDNGELTSRQHRNHFPKSHRHLQLVRGVAVVFADGDWCKDPNPHHRRAQKTKTKSLTCLYGLGLLGWASGSSRAASIALG
eukprot:1725309-Amphidinium_carterae.1